MASSVNKAVRARAQKLKEQSQTLQNKIDKIKAEQAMLNAQHKMKLINKLESAKQNRLEHLQRLQSKARRTSLQVNRRLYKDAITKSITPVLVKLRLVRLQQCPLESHQYHYLVKNHEHVFFKTTESILVLLGYKNPRVYTYTYFLVADLYDSIRDNTHSGLNVNHTNKTVNRQVNHLSLLLYKLSLQLQNDFNNMVSRNSPMELLDPLNLLRLRFSRTFYWFNHYFDLFRLLHYQNLSIILKDALHIVNQQLVIFHDKTLMKHKQFLLKQLTLSPPNLDLTACSSTLEKLSSIREIRGAIHLRYSSDIHIPESLHVCWISFNVHKIVTPPYVALKRWRQFFFDKWISSNSQFRFQTGRVASTNKNLDNYDLLKSVTIPSELSVSRLNLFIKNFQLVTGCQLEPVQDISQVDDLKQSILAVGHLSIDPASIFDFSSFEISLLSYWIKHFSFSFEKFQVFENILPFLNNDKYTPELGTASPSLRFPRFYNFLVSNGVRFSFTNLNLCKFSMLSFICTQQIKTLQFFTRLFLHNLVKGELVVDELNTLVLEHLKEFQLQAKAIINNVVHHQLATAYRGQTSSFSRHVTLVQFTQLHGGPKSRVYRVVASRFIEGILSRSANGIFDAQRAEMERFCRSFHRLFRYYYGILHPTLNWIYQDLGL